MQLETRRAFTIVPEGPFSLREAATFGFGQRLETTWDGVMRLAFCVDGYAEQAGVEVRQDEGGVHCVVLGDADIDPATGMPRGMHDDDASPLDRGEPFDPFRG